ncbi:SoxR reducing system RseC family protein [Kosakonia sp. S42]|uniref:SoxR reducing system RseC family protein n=1 Tax=Kosakonia sp. S42 TaxID=2767458 RepID=UPI00190C84D4|nr:SoxR reducing system RseC family protein [Kosakonia sp. S42]MBK0019459.1 hypothetical protein [Kosakonia sp. S42]
MENTGISQGESHEYRMSWLAYVVPFLTFIVITLVGFSISRSVTPAASILGYILIALSFLIFILKVMFIKTLKLYINNDGVYLFKGIFPWTKGVIGTTWRDISDANYYTGFISWATKSYRVRVGHRFTKTSELVIPHIKHGNKAVIEINEIINAKYRDMA